MNEPRASAGTPNHTSGPSAGAWQETNQVWHRLQFIYCDACGRVIPRRFWAVDIDGVPRIFCDETCARLYRTYCAPLTDGPR